MKTARVSERMWKDCYGIVTIVENYDIDYFFEELK